ncbi:MAG: protein kinase [Chthoniobacterales bacterium]
MDNRVFLERYRLSVGRNGQPVELHRSPAARTYRAQEIETGREVALTIVSPAPTDAVTLERLEMEAKAAEKINQINLPRLRDFGRENDELIYVDEYCEGHTAAAWVAGRGVLPVGAVLRVALQVVDAMNATAFQRLHHHALNPDNIIFVSGQTVEGDWPPVKVLHWFVPPARPVGGEDARTESAARFASPEQLDGAPVGVRSEIYSLGATMWFLLTGVPPLAGADASRATKEKLRGVPKIVRHLLDRMLREDAAERPHDPVALAAYLQTCLARAERRTKMEQRFGLPVGAKARVVEPKARMPIPLKPLAWAAGILALATFALLFLPSPLARQRSVAVAAPATRLPESLPNEVPVVSKDSLGRIEDESGPSASDEIPRDENLRAETAAAPVSQASNESAAAAPAAAPALAASRSETVNPPNENLRAENAPAAVTRVSNETPRAETAAAPVVAAENARAEIPREEEATLASAEPEAAAPEEGPSESVSSSAPLVASNTVESRPVESSLPTEPESDISATPSPIIAQTNEPDTAASIPAPAEVAPEVVEEKPKAVALTSSSPKTTRRPGAVRPTTKKKSVAVAARASTQTKTRHSTRITKRARALPKLRVGSAPAELVGTTSDGRWILSVEDSGRRVIVPPPPGFAP